MTDNHDSPETPPVLLIVMGPPATGKTTLARDLRLPLLCKDTIKELLYDTLGWQDVPFSRQLGRASILLLLRFVEAQVAAGRSCIVECNFVPHYHDEFLKGLQTRCPFRLVQVLCRADHAVLRERYERRVASGTPGTSMASARPSSAKRRCARRRSPSRLRARSSRWTPRALRRWTMRRCWGGSGWFCVVG